MRILFLLPLIIILCGCSSRDCVKWHSEEVPEKKFKQVISIFGQDILITQDRTSGGYKKFVCDEWAKPNDY